MKATYINAQEFTDAQGMKHYKIRYSATPDQAVTNFNDESGNPLQVRLLGQKIFDIKCNADAFAALRSTESGSQVNFQLQPNPANPRTNIITGIVA
jgi:hypothetical protein